MVEDCVVSRHNHLKNVCLAFCQCYRESDKSNRRHFNLAEHKRCYYLGLCKYCVNIISWLVKKSHSIREVSVEIRCFMSHRSSVVSLTEINTHRLTTNVTRLMQKTNTAFQTSLYEKIVKQDNTVTQRGLEPRTLSLSRGSSA